MVGISRIWDIIHIQTLGCIFLAFLLSIPWYQPLVISTNNSTHHACILNCDFWNLGWLLNVVQIRRRILRPFLVAHEGRPRRHDMTTDGIFTTKEVGASPTHDRLASFYHKMRAYCRQLVTPPPPLWWTGTAIVAVLWSRQKRLFASGRRGLRVPNIREIHRILEDKFLFSLEYFMFPSATPSV